MFGRSVHLTSTSIAVKPRWQQRHIVEIKTDFFQSKSAKSGTRFIYEGKQERNASHKKGKNRLKAVQALKWSEPKMFLKNIHYNGIHKSPRCRCCAQNKNVRDTFCCHFGRNVHFSVLTWMWLKHGRHRLSLFSVKCEITFKKKLNDSQCPLSLQLIHRNTLYTPIYSKASRIYNKIQTTPQFYLQKKNLEVCLLQSPYMTKKAKGRSRIHNKSSELHLW